MPRYSNRSPRICKHREEARVWLGHWVTLGKWGAPGVKGAYRNAVADWRERGCPSISGVRPDAGELAGDYLEFIKQAKSADSFSRAKLALRSFLEQYRDRDARAIGPVVLDDWRMALAREGLIRSTINERAWVVKDMVRWAVRREMIPAECWHLISTVRGLRRNEFGARDRPRVRAVALEVVAKTAPHLPPVVAAMVECQRASAARPGEMCRMTPSEIDTTGAVWLYRPVHHKTAHHGVERCIALGPRAQAALQPWWRPHEPHLPVFRPSDAKPIRTDRLRLAAGKPNRTRDMERRRRRAAGFVGDRDPGQFYTTQSYGKAIARACEAAGVPTWSPNQLRHQRLTEIHDATGLADAAAAGGHRKVETTQVYTEVATARAIQVAARTG